MDVVFFFEEVWSTDLVAGLETAFVTADLGGFLLDLIGDVSADKGSDIKAIPRVITMTLIALDPVRTGDLVHDVARTARKAPT